MEAITNTSDHSNKNYFESAAVSSYVWEMKMKQNETPSLTGNAKISFAIFQQNDAYFVSTKKLNRSLPKPIRTIKDYFQYILFFSKSKKEIFLES